MSHLSTLLQDTIKPNRLQEVEWLIDYMQRGNAAGEPIFLSLGETWERIPEALTALVAQAPRHVHGYHLAMAGYPPLRRKAQKMLEREYALAPAWHEEGRYTTGVCATGTRAVMYDYARCLVKTRAGGRQPVIVTAAPAWDYSGVFRSAGFTPHFIPLLPEDGFAPSPEGIVSEIEKIAADKSLFPVFALNAQHNPTGINWPEGVVSAIIDALVRHDVPLLVDDAYFSITAPGVSPACAMPLLLRRLEQEEKRGFTWLLVRSLGKQFNCNGWGVGVVAGPPALVEELFNEWLVHHHYNINGLFQYALSEWIGTPQAAEYTAALASSIHQNREFFLDGLQDRLGFPRGLAPLAQCTSFQLFPVPRRYAQSADGAQGFVRDCVAATGVLFTDAWPLPYNRNAENRRYDYGRVFLAGRQGDLEEAIERMKKAGFHYDD